MKWPSQKPFYIHRLHLLYVMLLSLEREKAIGLYDSKYFNMVELIANIAIFFIFYHKHKNIVKFFLLNF